MSQKNYYYWIATKPFTMFKQALCDQSEKFTIKESTLANFIKMVHVIAP